MGRGRAKAKQTKVARRLKYSTTGTDLERLQAELGGSGSDAAEEDALDDEEYDDTYSPEDEDEAAGP